MNGLIKTSDIAQIIETTINTPTKQYTTEEAEKVLQNCGILNRNKSIKKVYKNIIVKI